MNKNRKPKNESRLKMKHTGGKWIVKAQSGMLGVGVISVHTEVDGKKIFICDLPVKDVGETKSNANLIALAPEMFKMLRHINKTLQYCANTQFEGESPEGSLQGEIYRLIKETDRY
jgi:hypothetical protein